MTACSPEIMTVLFIKELTGKNTSILDAIKKINTNTTNIKKIRLYHNAGQTRTKVYHDKA